MVYWFMCRGHKLLWRKPLMTSVYTPRPHRNAQMGAALLLLLLALAAGVVIGGVAMHFYTLPSAQNTADSADAENDTAPAQLNQLAKQGKLSVEKRFDTIDPALNGYLVKSGTSYQVVYGLGDYLLVGNLISPAGENMNAKYTDEYRPKIDLGKVVEQIKKQALVVVTGAGQAPVLYAFADPNCIYCHRLYEAAQPLVEAGRLQIRWVMVAFLKKTSPGRAAAILLAEHPAQALHGNEEDFDAANEQGGIAPLTTIPADITAQLKTHAELMTQAGGTGTPTVIYRDKAGNWAAIYGAPKEKWLEAYATPLPGAKTDSEADKAAADQPADNTGKAE